LITNLCGSTNSAPATLAVLPATTSTPLTNTTVCLGDNVLFSTTTSGTGPFAYLWRKTGALIDGQTNNFLTLNSVSAADAGDYCVELAGRCNSVTNCATLTVNTNTTADPLLPLTNCPGATASFSTTAHGTGPFPYQWTSNGTNISGATDSSLVLPNVTADSAGTYAVQVSGACNSVTNFATLTFNTPTTATPPA